MSKLIEKLRQTRLAHMLGLNPKKPMGQAQQAAMVCSQLLTQPEFRGCRLEMWRKSGLDTPKEAWIYPVMRFAKGEVVKIEPAAYAQPKDVFRLTVWDAEDKAIYVLKAADDLPRTGVSEYPRFHRNPPSYGNLRYCVGSEELKDTLIQICSLISLKNSETEKTESSRTLAQLEMGN